MTHSESALPSLDLREGWNDNAGAEAVRPGAGFSFRYDGKTVGPEFSTDWHRAMAQNAQTGFTQTVLAHDSGLVVTRHMRRMPTFDAVEYEVCFKNSGDKTLPTISAIHALNLSLDWPALDESCVVSSGGGMNEGFLPPRTFALRTHRFAPTVPDAGMVDLTTEGGRSSNRDLPFFFIHNDTRQEGVFIAFGWSGQWSALIQRDPGTGTLSVRGKIPDLDIALAAGEEMAGPTVLLGFYEGDLASGSNRLRRLVREVYTPKLSGQTFLPIATYDTFFGIGVEFDETLLKKLADGAAATGQEYFLLDAGWYAEAGSGHDFNAGVGNWYQIDKNRLPNGLKPVADYVRSKGLKFGLWFEPERVAEGTQLAKEHPEWILWKHGKESEAMTWIRELHPDMESLKKRYGLLDYGRPEVQQWVKDLLDRYIGDYDVKYIRYDFNLDPLPYWEANDEPSRRGMMQLRHIQGFYSIIDWIRERHPDTVLEGCASGGRRIDLETVRRFHTCWISDYTVDPSIVRYHLFGINYFLPGSHHYVQYTLPLPHQKEFQSDDLAFQSLFGGAWGIGGHVDRWPEPMQRKARLHVEAWKKLRRYLIEDYYPLSGQPDDLQSWSGWQFHDPNDQSGFIQTFRTHTPDATQRFFIRQLDEQARYRFTNAYGAASFEMTGKTAMQTGIELVQEPMTSKVFTYRRLST